MLGIAFYIVMLIVIILSVMVPSMERYSVDYCRNLAIKLNVIVLNVVAQGFSSSDLIFKSHLDIQFCRAMHLFHRQT